MKKMRNIYKITKHSGLLLFTLLCVISACEYQRVADVDYPDQVLYLPASVEGVFDVDKKVVCVSVPTEGCPNRYWVDDANNQLVIPMGVYRSGINNSGDVIVHIKANSDTINSLIDSNVLLGTMLIPRDKMIFPESVVVLDGNDLGVFNLLIDLNFIKENPFNCAIGIEIESDDREVNQLLNTAVVHIKSGSL